MTDRYTNREIDALAKDMKDQLDRIEIQVTRTNGRVSKLENWKGYITGAVAVLVLITIGVIFPIVIYIVTNHKL